MNLNIHIQDTAQVNVTWTGQKNLDSSVSSGREGEGENGRERVNGLKYSMCYTDITP